MPGDIAIQASGFSSMMIRNFVPLNDYLELNSISSPAPMTGNWPRHSGQARLRPDLVDMFFTTSGQRVALRKQSRPWSCSAHNETTASR